MTLPDAGPRTDAVAIHPDAPRKRRAIVCGGGLGMFPPLMERFRQEFEIVEQLRLDHGRLTGWFYRLLAIRWPRTAWYREWRYYMEKTPASFRRLTRDFTRQMRPMEGRYDVTIIFGAVFSPELVGDTPYFIVTDSCRWLSSRNPHDAVSHFRSPEDASSWLGMEGVVYRAATRVFVGTDFVRNALVHQYGVSAERVVVCGFGAGEAFGAPYEKTFDNQSILYIGKGDFEKKGGVLLLEAFAHVRKVMPQATLHLVGQDKLPEIDGVINHGFVRDRAKLVGLMRTAHVFALPSLVDRNPISILEAMAAATPCIASDYGAMPDMVGAAGLIVRAGDVAALQTALLQVLGDTELARRLGEEGRRRYLALFNWDSVWATMQREMRAALGRLPA